jgi:hypothetical protein
MNKVTIVVAALAVLCFVPHASADLDNMDIGGDVKVLGYLGENTTDFNDNSGDQTDFLRVEAHLWFDADLSDNVTTRISVEVDRDMDTLDVEGGPASASADDLEVFLEEAWVKVAYIYDSAMSVQIGRQFIELGDGFLIGDSSPGSETLNGKGEYEVDPFDAVRFTYDGDDWVLDLIYMKTIETGTLDFDAELYTAYFTYNGWEDYVLDVYFIMQDFDGVDPFASRGSVALGYGGYDDSYSDGHLSSSHGSINNGEVYALGARLAGSALDDSLTYKLEGVYEFGEVDLSGTSADPDVSAYAIEAGLKYMFDAEYNPWVSLTYVLLSGDNDADDFEIFLPFAENRTYGEIGDLFASTNLHITNLAGGIDINEDVALSLQYYYFHAFDEDTIWGGEDDIGHEFDVYLDYQFSEETSAVLAGGFLIPDDAIEGAYGDDDDAWFVRAGVKVEF